MISVTQACSAILDELSPVSHESVASLEAMGRVLAEDVVSSIDSPPFAKALMDGYAVCSADPWPDQVLDVLEVVPAGATPQCTVVPGSATRVMTGAPLPAGADAVVMLEETETVAPDKVRLCRAAVPPQLNLLEQGTCLRRGDAVLRAGTRISPAVLGLLAELGKSHVAVYRPVTAAILATGNELVEIDEPLEEGQIRNSNGPMLAGLAAAAGARVTPLGVARDHAEDLRSRVDQGLECDMLLLSGGVSAGDLDLVPQILRDCGVEEVFHKVRIKPGKPLWFGRKASTLVFGLPGNPVSSFACFHCFVRPAIAKRSGDRLGPASAWVTRSLIGDFTPKGDRIVYYPARLFGGDSVERLDWKGSADLRTVAEADCLVELPSGDPLYDGARVRVLTWPT